MITASPQRTKRCLLVEDDPHHARLIGYAVHDYGDDVAIDHVTDGEAALDFLRREGNYTSAVRPDVVLLDLNLPKLSGQDVLETIRSDPSFDLLPVVVLTTSSDEEDVQRAYASHTNGYVVKPTDPKLLNETIGTICSYWTRTNHTAS